MDRQRNQKDKTPALAVVMAVKDGGKFVGRAIESILSQSFDDFEFVIVNDGSTDDTPQILDLYAASDSRVKVHHQSNVGLGASLNKAIQATTAPLIARQDADDISLPGRLEEQVAFLIANPQVVVCGTWAEIMHEPWGYTFGLRVPYTALAVRKALEKGDRPIVHGSAVIRRSALVAEGSGYRFRGCSQDADLWLRLLSYGDIVILPRILYRYTVSPDAVSYRKASQQQRGSALAQQLFRERSQYGTEKTEWLRAEQAIIKDERARGVGDPLWSYEYLVGSRLALAGQHELAAPHLAAFLAECPDRSVKKLSIRLLGRFPYLLRGLLFLRVRALSGNGASLTFLRRCPGANEGSNE
jgi:glycosyltransferase involved in cell wall biosynthesis